MVVGLGLDLERKLWRQKSIFCGEPVVGGVRNWQEHEESVDGMMTQLNRSARNFAKRDESIVKSR